MKRSRTAITFIGCTLAVPTATYLLPGLAAEEPIQAVAAGVILGLAYLVVRPAARLLTLPLGCLTLGLFNFVIDIGLIYLCHYFIPGFTVDSPLTALLTAIFVNLVCAIAGGFR